MGLLVSSGWLHIGNIAGNGFEAASLQRKLGMQSDVINPYLTHLISHPIWTDVKVSDFIDINDLESLQKSNPNWKEPEYYYGGDFESALRKLALKNQTSLVSKAGTTEYVLKAWQLLGKSVYRFIKKLIRTFPPDEIAFSSNATEPTLEKNSPFSKANKFKAFKKYGYKLLHGLYMLPIKLLSSLISKKTQKQFLNLAPQQYFLIPALRCFIEVSKKYDGVVLYGPWAALGAWCRDLNFIAVEHGTLRDYIFTDDEWAKACREGFKKARKVIVTNADCYPISLSENHKETIPGIHPFDDEYCEEYANLRREYLEISANRPRSVILASRFQFSNSIDAKGSDIALAAIKKLHSKFPELTFTIFAYGGDFDNAKGLLLQNGLNQVVNVSAPLSRPVLLEKFSKALCILDGFSLAGSGRIQIEAWRLGVPVLSKQDERLNSIFFKEKTPTFHADSESQIVAIVSDLFSLDNSKLLALQVQALGWYKRNHSSDRFLSYLT
jgi:glycosyltransferase involved in cell wall biosynthesis